MKFSIDFLFDDLPSFTGEKWSIENQLLRSWLLFYSYKLLSYFVDSRNFKLYKVCDIDIMCELLFRASYTQLQNQPKARKKENNPKPNLFSNRELSINSHQISGNRFSVENSLLLRNANHILLSISWSITSEKWPFPRCNCTLYLHQLIIACHLWKMIYLVISSAYLGRHVMN